jgi:hypothetical protein
MSDSQQERINIPEGVTFDTLNRILLAYLKAGAYERPVSYKEAANTSGVHPTLISLNNKFLVSSGFLTEESRGNFKLSEKATRYVQLLDWEKEEEAKEPLRELLPEYSFIKQILDFVTINKKVTREELETRVVSIARVQKRSRYITGINALLEMLTFSGLLNEQDGTFSSGKPTKAEVPVVPAKLIEIPPVEVKKPVIPISLSLMIDEKTDVEKLKAVIRALREVLQE